MAKMQSKDAPSNNAQIAAMRLPGDTEVRALLREAAQLHGEKKYAHAARVALKAAAQAKSTVAKTSVVRAWASAVGELPFRQGVMYAKRAFREDVGIVLAPYAERILAEDLPLKGLISANEDINKGDYKRAAHTARTAALLPAEPVLAGMIGEVWEKAISHMQPKEGYGWAQLEETHPTLGDRAKQVMDSMVNPAPTRPTIFRSDEIRDFAPSR